MCCLPFADGLICTNVEYSSVVIRTYESYLPEVPGRSLAVGRHVKDYVVRSVT
jgi:hypothetical protein